MEVAHKKQLHHHALPIVILGVAVLVSTLVFAFHISYGNISTNDMLTERWFTISPAKNGLFEVNKVVKEQKSALTIGDVSDAGNSAQLQTSLYAQ